MRPEECGNWVCDDCGKTLAEHQFCECGCAQYICPGRGVTVPFFKFHAPPFPAIPVPANEPATAAGHPDYLAILDEMRELHIRKAADYGRGADPFANVRASAEFGIPAWVGVMVRAGDKLHRIKSLIVNGSLKNESVEDSLKDLAAYSLIALVLLREDAAKKGSDK